MLNAARLIPMERTVKPCMDMVILPDQFSGFCRVMDIGSRAFDCVNIPRSCIHSGVNLHSMIPLIPLLRLMHLRISGSCTVFRGTGSRNDGSIHNRTAMHQQAGFLKAIPDVSKNLLSDVVFLKQMAELQPC